MPVFQVTSISPQSATPPKKRARRLPYQWYIAARFVVGITIAGLCFIMLNKFTQTFHVSSDTVFILLPVFLSLATAHFRGNNFNILLRGTPIYLLLTACLTIIYYSTIILGISFIQQSISSYIIIISTALAWTILLEPVRTYIQKRIERRFNVRNREVVKAIEAFTSTLREEIDLDQLREHFITIIQQNMRPYSLSLWIRTSHEQQGKSGSSEEITSAADDPLIAYMLRHARVLEVDHL